MIGSSKKLSAYWTITLQASIPQEMANVFVDRSHDQWCHNIIGHVTKYYWSPGTIETVHGNLEHSNLWSKIEQSEITWQEFKPTPDN